MEIKVVSDAGVASFNIVTQGVIHVLKDLGHEVEYQNWGEATVHDAPKNILVIGYPYYGSIAYCQRWLGKRKIVFYSATEGMPVLDAYSKGLAENITFVTPSQYSKTMLQESGLPNVAGVVHHGVDMSIESDPYYDKMLRKFYPKDIDVLFVCAENNIRKGFNHLLVALKLVKRERKNVRLIMHTAFRKVSGRLLRGHYDLEGIRQILQLSSKDVWITDMYAALTYRQLQSLYRLAKIYACSSLSEGFCIPIIEAKRWNTPTIALEYLPFTETIKHEVTGLLIPRRGQARWSMWPREQPRINTEIKDYSVDDYADAIIRLLKRKTTYKRIAKNIERTKNQWDMFNTYPQILEYFK